MTAFYVVVEKPGDWQPYYPSQDVITFDEYLNKTFPANTKRVRIINLCRNYRYLGTGYYCSLLAEARGHHVFPSVATINDLGRRDLASLQLENLARSLEKLSIPAEQTSLTFRCWFGETLHPELTDLAEHIFEAFPCPLLEISLENRNGWKLKQVRAASLKSLSDSTEQEAFANTFESFSRKMWRKPRTRKSFRYDLAILVNPKEELPPSDEKALKKFEKAATQLGIATERITRKDYMRIAEYDALFIRETTAVNHYTYRFAKKAEAEDLVVIDDPASILRCTNKIYLADLLKTHNVPTPASAILSNCDETSLNRVVAEIGLPMVLKIPDGSFSRGVIKVETVDELKQQARALLKQSALVIAQEFLYTRYDWRIGVLNNKPLYACRYYMVDDHWQIYQHGETTESGDFDTLPTFEAPAAVLDAAVRATKLIGNGFYGVDIKQTDTRVVVIEVNDNPSIESGVEDRYLGDRLYTEIMTEFLRRMESRGR